MCVHLRFLSRVVIAVLLPLFLLAAIPALAQAPAGGPQPAGKPPEQSETRSAPAKEETPEQKQRRLTLERIVRIAERLAALPDDKEGDEKVRALADLAGAICKYDTDEARRLFLQLTPPANVPAGKATFSDLTVAPIVDSGSPERGRLVSSWQRVLTQATGCDAMLVEQLRKKLPETNGPAYAARQQVKTLLGSAELALDSQPEKAAALMTEALESGGAEVLQTAFVEMLRRLSAQDRKAADALFLSTVAQLRGLPSISVRNLLLLGTYLFCSPGVCEGQPVPAMMLAGDLKSGLSTVTVDLFPERPGVQPALVHAYLDVATDFLSRATSNEEEKPVAFVAAIQLLPRIRQYLPNRAAALEAALPALQSQSQEVASQLGLGEFLSQPRPAENPEDRERRLANGLNPGMRDLAYFSEACQLGNSQQFAQAREAAEKLLDGSVKGSVRRWIDVREGAQALGQGETQRAGQIADRLPPGAERAVLRTGLAAARAKTDKQAAIDTALAALGDAEAVTDGAQPYIEVAVATVLAELDAKLALQVFQLAVAGLNSSSATHSGWGVAVPAPAGIRGFPTTLSYTVSGGDFTVSGQLGPLVSLLAERAPEETEAAALSLTSDRHLLVALPALATALLRQLAQPRAKQAPRENEALHH